MYRVGPVSGEQLSKEMQQYARLVSQLNDVAKEKGFNLLASEEAAKIEELKRNDQLGDAAVKLLELIEQLKLMPAIQKKLPPPPEPPMGTRQFTSPKRRTHQRHSKKLLERKSPKKEQEKTELLPVEPKQDSFLEGFSKCLLMLCCPARFNEKCREELPKMKFK